MFLRMFLAKYFHLRPDEWLTSVDIGTEDKWIEVANEAMRKVNEVLKLNKEITIGTDVGYSYSECH